MKLMTKLSVVLIAATACMSSPAHAQDSNAGTTNTAPATPKPRRNAMQFRGIIASVDSGAMTLTLKGRSGTETKVKVISTTKIFNGNEPGMFSDAVEGKRIFGEGKKGEDGVWTAHTLHITTRAPKPKAPADGSTTEQK